MKSIQVLEESKSLEDSFERLLGLSIIHDGDTWTLKIMTTRRYPAIAVNVQSALTLSNLIPEAEEHYGERILRFYIDEVLQTIELVLESGFRINAKP